VPGCADRQLSTLRLFGLSPDGDVVFQSSRVALYDATFERLRAQSGVYACRCSRREIAQAASAPRGPEGPPYPGTCRDLDVAPAQARSWRFRVSGGAVEFDDAVFGRRSQEVSKKVGDFVVAREAPERSYAYQFAVVVDDAAQGVTQVVRGADLLDSTPRQIALARALGYPRPTYAHVPLLVASEGGKLSKRLGSVGFDASAGSAERRRLLARLLELLGQERTLACAIDRFDPSRIPREKTIEFG
jgi:glutamyl-Q tRNA(Asp) synthetase